ncbi:MAG: aminoacyl-tRNA hydrolase [Ruminococcaceae bacterium]|nr:aminoacyl-tRNA hydrolase [Oscillospiraceae bacterium]
MSNLFDLFRKISSEQSVPSGPVTHIVAGLGNPGDKYIYTRHNAGFMAMDYLAQKYNLKINKLRFKSLCAETAVNGKRVLFMKPQTFMNLSGEAVREAADFYKIPSENIIIIYDDVSFEPGTMRIKRKGSAGGHNGIKNIILEMNTDVFPRIKLGVGVKPKEYDMVGWVLGKLTPEGQKELFTCLEKTPEAIELIVSGNTDKAMNLFN